MTSRDDRAIRAAIETRIKRRAAAAGRTAGEERRRFVAARFLAAVFAHDPDGWVLKGGMSMMLRLPVARHTKDVDLARAGGDLKEAVAAVRAALAASPDPIVWTVDTEAALTGTNNGVRLKVTAHLAGTFEEFGIDIVARGDLAGAVERSRIEPDPEVPEFGSGADVLLFPIADQVADKLCAMYERHNAIASSRLRDLNDLLLIQMHHRFSLSEAARAALAQQVRRSMRLPERLVAPHTTWEAQWPKAVRRFPLGRDLWSLEATLSRAASCYEPVLAAVTERNISSGLLWDPPTNAWI